MDPRVDDEPTTGATLESAQGRADRSGIEHAVQPLRSGGSGRLLVLVCVAAAALALLVWQPWGRGSSRTPSSQASQAPAIAVGQASPSLPPTSTVIEGPAPSPAPAAILAADTQPYVSLVDNEWTVVALLSADGPVSTEEPSIQHGRGSWSTGDEVLVLQQGLDDQVRPIDTRKAPDAACTAPTGSRDRSAVHLPGGRVAYLGVTFPGMDPRARVTATVLDRAGVALSRVVSPVVRIRGMIAARQYLMPSSGFGGAVLFALDPPVVLPPAAYRFDIESPGVSGHRYLYACVGS
jgi:hypothetical protein